MAETVYDNRQQAVQQLEEGKLTIVPFVGEARKKVVAMSLKLASAKAQANAKRRRTISLSSLSTKPELTPLVDSSLGKAMIGSSSLSGKPHFTPLAYSRLGKAIEEAANFLDKNKLAT